MTESGASAVPGLRVLPRSIAMRTALAATAVALAAVSALCAVTYSVTEAGLTRGVAMTIDADLAGLADLYATGGRPELIARLADRQGLLVRDGRQPHYLLRASGARTPGGIETPVLDAARSQQGYVTLPDGTPVYARATLLGRDVELLVAREYVPERRTLRLLLLSFAITGCGIVAAVFLLAWRQSLATARRLDRINAVYRDSSAAAIDRLIGDPAGDEIGELSRRSGQALERMQRLIESQRHVSEHVAHELRTPLLHLDGRLRQLARTVPETASETVRLASADIRGITTMLEALLDIASNQAERGDRAALVPVDLSMLADDLGEIYRGSMEEAGLHLVTAIAPGVGLPGDPTQLGRLLANLLDNAVKYVPAGGTVRLEVTEGPTIVVADDGPGIPPAMAEQVFERFRRGGAPSGTGHGLGLALARAIAERHDLTLTLHPSARGARFVVAR